MNKKIVNLFPFIFIVVFTSIPACANEVVKVGNANINICEKGSGKNTIIFDTGYGDSFDYKELENQTDVWNELQDSLSNYSKTISYERPGLGLSKSKNGNMPDLPEDEITKILNNELVTYNPSTFNGKYKTARDKAINLHKLLKKRHLKAPYTFIVHSLSSYTSIEFAKLYPREVNAIIMLDGTPMDNFQCYINYNICSREFVESICTPADGTFSEILMSSNQVKSTKYKIKNIPLLYLQASNDEESEVFRSFHSNGADELISLFENHKKLVVPNSTHYVHYTNFDFVNNEILKFLRENQII